MAAPPPAVTAKDLDAGLLLDAARLVALNGYADACRLLPFLSPDYAREKDFLVATKHVRYGKQQRTRLMSLARQDDMKRAALLLRVSADANAKDLSGDTPLHFTCERGHVDTARLLLDKGAGKDARDKNGSTPLHRATHSADGRNMEPAEAAKRAARQLAVVRLLVDEHGADVRAVTYDDGWSPLHSAVSVFDEALVRFFLDRGADPGAPVCDGRTPLSLATFCDGGESTLPILRLLVQRGAIVGRKSRRASIEDGSDSDEDGDDDDEDDEDEDDEVDDDDVETSPLWYACVNGGREDVVRFLLRRGASVNVEDDDGNTPLHQASADGNAAVVRLLLKRGADMEAQAYDGATPLISACRGGLRRTEAAVRVLVDRGADMEAQDEQGQTPLMLASFDDDMPVVAFLVKRGANVDARDFMGYTALHLASEKCSEKVVRFLLSEGGADVNAVDDDGYTPLHDASIYPHEAMATIRLLLDKGARVNAKNVHGETPLHLACEEGRKGAAELLVARGARTGRGRRPSCRQRRPPRTSFRGGGGMGVGIITFSSSGGGRLCVCVCVCRDSFYCWCRWGGGVCKGSRSAVITTNSRGPHHQIPHHSFFVGRPPATTPAARGDNCREEKGNWDGAHPFTYRHNAGPSPPGAIYARTLPPPSVWGVWGEGAEGSGRSSRGPAKHTPGRIASHMQEYRTNNMGLEDGAVWGGAAAHARPTCPAGGGTRRVRVSPPSLLFTYRHTPLSRPKRPPSLFLFSFHKFLPPHQEAADAGGVRQRSAQNRTVVVGWGAWLARVPTSRPPRPRRC
jgi:ankyrin repeat protein